MDKRLSVAVISGRVGKSPREITRCFVFDEIYRLAGRGIEVHVIRSKMEKESMSYGIHFYGIERKIDIQAAALLLKNIANYPPISFLRNPKRLYWENLYALNVSRVIERNNIDLIHAHFAYPEGLVGLLAKRRTGKPLIVTVHGYDINIVPEIGYGIRLNKKLDILVRMVLKQADAIICVSPELRRKVLKLGVPKEKLFIVFNGIDLNLYRPPSEKESNEINDIRRSLGVNEDDFLILNARHLRPVYGLEYLIKAARLVTENIKNVKFIIAGDGPLYKQLHNMVCCLGLEKNVRLIGLVPRFLMPKLMQASDIYVNTSLSDGMPPSLLEAIACGKPVISFDVGGARDIIDNNINGFLVPVKDYKMLASKIIYLLKNPHFMKNMGLKARKKAEDKFDINKRIDKITSIYEKIMENPNR